MFKAHLKKWLIVGTMVFTACQSNTQLQTPTQLKQATPEATKLPFPALTSPFPGEGTPVPTVVKATPTPAPSVVKATATPLPSENPRAPSSDPAFTLRNQWMWKVTKAGAPTSYLVGSVHAPFATDYEPPQDFWDNITSASTLFIETDVSDASALQSQVLLTAFDLSQNLQSQFDANTWNKLLERTRKVGLPDSAVPTLKPWYLYLVISSSGNPQSAPQTSMDLILKNEAEKLGLKTDILEEASVQLGQLQKVSDPEYIRLIRENLENNTDATASTRRIFEAYNTNNKAALVALEQESKAQSAEFHQAVLVERNQNWINKLKPRLEKEALVVVAGSLHMFGEQGLIALLETEGYRIERVTL